MSKAKEFAIEIINIASDNQLTVEEFQDAAEMAVIMVMQDAKVVKHEEKIQAGR